MFDLKIKRKKKHVKTKVCSRINDTLRVRSLKTSLEKRAAKNSVEPMTTRSKNSSFLICSKKTK